MSCSVGWLGDVLSTSERLQQLVKMHSIRIVNVDARVTADDDRTAVRR